jgi:hypothetical protein
MSEPIDLEFHRTLLVRRRDELLREREATTLPSVPIGDDVSDEEFLALSEGTFVRTKKDEAARVIRSLRQREWITVNEAAWVIGHKDSQSLRRICREGKYPQRMHYALPWSIENHHRVFFRLEGSNRILVNFHAWSRYLMSKDQLKRLEAIEFEPED